MARIGQIGSLSVYEFEEGLVVVIKAWACCNCSCLNFILLRHQNLLRACSFHCLRSPQNELWGELGFPIRIIELWASPTYVESSPVSALASDSKQARFLM